MSKIIVRCKDKTTTHWLAAQNKSVVGDIPAVVEHTEYVTRCIRSGVFEQVELKEYEHFHKKLAKTDDDKADVILEVFDNAIDNMDIDLATKQVAKLKAFGLKGNKLRSINGKLTRARQKFEKEQEQNARDDKALDLVTECIEKEVLTKNDDNEYFLGDTRLGADEEEIVTWAAKSNENIEILANALEKLPDSGGSTDDE